MAQPLDIPLPELTVDGAWTRFELVAKAKYWDSAKQLTVLPTLLRGKLVDHYVDFDDETKTDLAKLKAALEKVTGRTEDPLAAAREFVSRDQHPNERAEDFATALKRLFKQAYPSEAATSSVLLQRFMTGLRPSVSQQLLLRSKPKELSEAIEGAAAVEYTLSFDKGRATNQPKSVHALQPCVTPKECSQDKISALQNSLEEMTKRMEALETALKGQEGRSKPPPMDVDTGGGGKNSVGVRPESRSRNRRIVTCYFCGLDGHIRRNCPALNFSGPARTAGGRPGHY